MKPLNMVLTLSEGESLTNAYDKYTHLIHFVHLVSTLVVG